MNTNAMVLVSTKRCCANFWDTLNVKIADSKSPLDDGVAVHVTQNVVLHLNTWSWCWSPYSKMFRAARTRTHSKSRLSCEFW